ncbi:50S ribosomal protein L29 [Candidatus Uhrbacteria bacterium]|nr:50S ribosomal protein L29 [Candidatus Uhrbacteria bacterium]
MKIKELRDKTELELNQLLQEKRIAVREMRFRAALRELKNVRDIRKARKTIAQILSILPKKKTHI